MHRGTHKDGRGAARMPSPCAHGATWREMRSGNPNAIRSHMADCRTSACQGPLLRRRFSPAQIVGVNVPLAISIKEPPALSHDIKVLCDVGGHATFALVGSQLMHQ
eukprot:scaffold88449_cov30-Tisochrysis_lutea.AAC.3